MPDVFLSQPFIKIDSQDVPQAFMDDILEVVVDISLYLPEMFTILLEDSDLKWVDNTDLLELGKEVAISAQASNELGGEKGPLMTGEITVLEPNFSAKSETTLLIRGYNKFHRLHRGKKTRTFLKQSDSDIAKKIAGEMGLSPQIDNTVIRYDYVIQSNQTNMEFLQARAGRIGYQVFAADGKLYFKKGEQNLGAGPQLKLGEALRNFRPTLAATHQADKIRLMGWDSKKKEVIKSEAPPNSQMNQGGIGKTGGAVAKQAFGGAEAILVHQPVFTPDEAKALAQGLANDIGSEFIQAEGLSFGHPKIKGGYTITISGVGKRFSGKYFVTAATHILRKGSYETQFSISGRQPNTVSHLLGQGNGRYQGRGLIQGVVTGLVTNLNDPDELGRVKVKYPWLGENIESDWMRIATPMAGSERGFYYLPEVNDEVLIGFEHGDIHHPYIIGALWSSKDKPPQPNSAVVGQGKVNQRILKSRSGHVIILDDTSGSEQIIIRDKTGKNEIIIDSKKNSMTINVTKDYLLDAKGNIDVKSAGNLTIDSKGNITIQSMGNVKIKGMGNLDLEATGMLNIKGATVSINGSALTEVKGAIVKIN